MKILKFCVVLLLSVNAFAATYTSTSDGAWGTGIGLPVASYHGGSTDIVYIDHAVTYTGNLTFAGDLGYELVIRDGGSLDVTGEFRSNTGTLTIDEGGSLSSTLGLGAHNNSGTFTINGIMTVSGGGIYQVANEWIIGATGVLNVTGVFNNDNSAMDMTVHGTVNVTGDANFHSGAYAIKTGGSFTSLGTTAIVGHANIVNDGLMFFPNTSTVTKWSGSFDCDGSGGGVVSFGFIANCAVCTGLGCVLPIELTYFTVREENDLVYFSWETIIEQQNEFFSIEYSYDAQNFETLIDRVNGAGDSYEATKYETSYPSVFTGIVYFRLKQTDYDGAFSYSDIATLLLEGTEIGVYPNPASTVVSIQISDKKGSYSASLIDPIGTSDLYTFEITNGSIDLDVSEFREGLYFLNVEGLAGAPQKVLIQH